MIEALIVRDYMHIGLMINVRFFPRNSVFSTYTDTICNGMSKTIQSPFIWTTHSRTTTGAIVKNLI